MRVATFNLQHGLPAAGGPVDPTLVEEACAGLGADLLALQELDRGVRRSGGHDLVAVAAAATGMEARFGATLRTGGGDFGNALLVRGTVEQLGYVHLPRLGRSEHRGAIVADVVVAGDRVRVAATHLGVAQAESELQLRAVRERLDEATGPRLLLGDLNRRPEQTAPLLPGYVLAAGGLSYPAADPRARIDHIAVAGDVVVRDVWVVRTPVSDHRAVVAEVELVTRP